MWFLADSLSPGTRLGEILFGLIMTLTFTLGAGAYFGGSEGATTDLLYATIGCNIAWGVIDAALMLFGTVFERSRRARLGTAIATSPNDDAAIAIVASELDETLVPITTADSRDALYRNVVAQVRSLDRPRPRLTRADFLAAVAIFWSVFAASFPAALPFLLIEDPWLALRASNALLIGILFWVGYRWAGYTNLSPLGTGLTLVAVSVTLVAIAIPLGG
jgi:VIT1/CCC1 family predicted Fe2+/Mn2+ transporter